MTDYEDTLPGLAERVKALEMAAATPAYAPLNGMVVAPDGSISYDFDGRIKAQGLDLAASEVTQPAPPTDLNRVQWLRAANGAQVAQIYGQHLDLTAQIGVVQNGGHLESYSSDGALHAGLHVSADDRNAIARGARVAVSAGTAANEKTVTLVTSDGPQVVRIDGRQSLVTVADATTPATPVGGLFSATFSHALGATPIAGVAMPSPGGGLVSNVPCEAFTGGTLDTATFLFRNNAGFALSPSSIRVLMALVA